MIVALLNQPHGVGKMTLALHPAGLWSYRTRHVTVIDADPQGRTLEWSEMRAQERLPRRFTVIGLTRNTLHRDAQNIACDVDRVIVDGLCHIAALARGAADRGFGAVPFWAAAVAPRGFPQDAEVRQQTEHVSAAAPYSDRSQPPHAHDLDAHEIAQALAKCDPPVLTSCIGRRAVLAEAVVNGRVAVGLAHSAAAGARKCARGPTV